ncbi:unnamed protein product [Withania somnifera]
MASSREEPISNPPIPNDDKDDVEINEDEDDDEEEEESRRPVSEESRIRSDRAKMENLFRRLSSERVPIRVHDVIIQGNTKTKESIIEAEMEALKNATTLQELLRAASIANARLQQLDIFDSVKITLDSGPPELPGTTNVVVEIVESENPLTGSVGVFSKPEARAWSLEGSLKLKNVFGYGDIWDGSLAYGWDLTSEVSVGVSLPTRLSLLSQDWLKFSSYKERALGLSLGLLSSGSHDLAYSLSWRTLADPLQMASRAVRRQLGHSLISALNYTFKIDRRNSSLRPTRGYAFLSSSQIGGLLPDHRGLRFLRQELDFRYALPLGFYNTAFNIGISAGVTVPWGSGFLSLPTFLPEKFFLGGNSSPVFTENSTDESSDASSAMDFVGGDLAVTAFADLSFDLPLRVLREAGIHGHAFACTGSLNKLTENAYKDLSLQKFKESFRASAGFGVIVPTKLFRMEVNYCYILKQQEHDRGKTGVQFSFCSSF